MYYPALTPLGAFMIFAIPIALGFLTWSLNKLGRGLGWWFLVLFVGPIAASVAYVQLTWVPPSEEAKAQTGL